MNNSFIMNLVRKEFKGDDFSVEPRIYRNRKNIMRKYKGFQILIERKFENFMNLILFRNIILKVWTEDFSQEVLINLVRAGMVLANIRIWRDFIISRDSCTNYIAKHSSNIYSPSKTISSSISKLNTSIAKVIPS